MGHTVVGIEGVETACREFFTDNDLEMVEVNNVPGFDGKLFKVSAWNNNPYYRSKHHEAYYFFTSQKYILVYLH